MTGRTKKHTSSGCGSCHSSGTTVTGLISGPDTVSTGATVNFTITLNGTNAGNYGVDIAVKSGVLNTGMSSGYLKILNEELTHISGLTINNLTFSYTAPSIPGFDTIYANVVKGYPGKWNYVPNKGIIVKQSIGIRRLAEQVNSFALFQNYPNPFNSMTKVKFSILNSGNVSIKIYDFLGRDVATIENDYLEQGSYSVLFDGSNLASGVYYYKLISENFSETKSMLLIK